MGRPRLADLQANQVERSLYTSLEAAELIGVTDRTLRDYKKLARFYVPDYRNINLINNELRTRLPLTAYQVWVLGKIANLFSKFPKGCSAKPKIKQWLKDNGDRVLTYEAYRNEISKTIPQVKK